MTQSPDITELYLTVRKLQGEIERLEKEKYPTGGNSVQKFLGRSVMGLAVIGGLFYFAAYAGMPSSFPRGYGTLNGEGISLHDGDSRGNIGIRYPEINLYNGKRESVRIDASGLKLENERGRFDLILYGDKAILSFCSNLEGGKRRYADIVISLPKDESKPAEMKFSDSQYSRNGVFFSLPDKDRAGLEIRDDTEKVVFKAP